MTTRTTLVAVALAVLVAGSGLAVAAPITQTADGAAGGEAAPDVLAQETTTLQSDMAQNATGNETASISVPDQSSNGSAVLVESVTVPEGGFLVVFAQNGSRLGNSTYLEPGSYENVTVELNTTIARSQVLVGALHVDTDDDQQFEFNASAAAGTTEAANATNVTILDGPYTAQGLPVTDVAFVTVGEDSRRTTEENASSRSRQALDR